MHPSVINVRVFRVLFAIFDQRWSSASKSIKSPRPGPRSLLIAPEESQLWCWCSLDEHDHLRWIVPAMTHLSGRCTASIWHSKVYVISSDIITPDTLLRNKTVCSKWKSYGYIQLDLNPTIWKVRGTSNETKGADFPFLGMWRPVIHHLL
jgi:hypothetical protein